MGTAVCLFYCKDLTSPYTFFDRSQSFVGGTVGQSSLSLSASEKGSSGNFPSKNLGQYLCIFSQLPTSTSNSELTNPFQVDNQQPKFLMNFARRTYRSPPDSHPTNSSSIGALSYHRYSISFQSQIIYFENFFIWASYAINMWEGMSYGSSITRDRLILSIVGTPGPLNAFYYSADCRSEGVYFGRLIIPNGVDTAVQFITSTSLCQIKSTTAKSSKLGYAFIQKGLEDIGPESSNCKGKVVEAKEDVDNWKVNFTQSSPLECFSPAAR